MQDNYQGYGTAGPSTNPGSNPQGQFARTGTSTPSDQKKPSASSEKTSLINNSGRPGDHSKVHEVGEESTCRIS